MILSERIGFCLEHLLVLELEDRGIRVRRSERPDNQTIKSDLSFSLGRLEYVIFVTHTRTQGMTNRKFYRTFEELAQRRIADPSAICVEVSLTDAGDNVPTQYGLIFRQLFDDSMSVLTPTQERRFVAFVEEVPTPFDIDATKAARSRLPAAVRRRFAAAIDRIVSVEHQRHLALTRYWASERKVTAGKMLFAPRDAASIKLGMKFLTLLEGHDLSLEELAQGRIPKRAGLDIEYLTAVGIINGTQSSIVGSFVVPSPPVRAAAGACLRNHISLDKGWSEQYLTSPGAKILRADLLSPARIKQRVESLSKKLSSIESPKELSREFRKEYESASERCDLVDLALRASGLSQNVVSVRVLASLGVVIRQRNPMWFLIAKEDGREDVVKNATAFLDAAAQQVWSECGGRFATIDWHDFFAARLQTYLAHRSVVPQLALLRSVDTASPRRTRQSVLPRLLDLPSKYRMSVTASRCWGHVFMVDVSTPDPQHHKHKEFAGKLRAIRYETTEVRKIATRFVMVLDGNWTESQRATLCNAGWDVYDWDSFLQNPPGLRG